MDDDLADLGAPNCPQCLHPMEAVVTAWWCADCQIRLSPEDWADTAR